MSIAPTEQAGRRRPIARARPVVANPSGSARVTGFRTKLFIAIMLLVSGVTALSLYLAERDLAANIERELYREFESELAGIRQSEAVRHAALVERCRALVRKPRIHAALEDGALDLLYPSAEDELRDVMTPASDDGGGAAAMLRARFYRFLDRDGRVIAPGAAAPVGRLPPDTEARLRLPSVNESSALGFLIDADTGGPMVTEIIATPIVSTETNQPIAALVLGFRPLELSAVPRLRNGVWADGRLALAGLKPAESEHVMRELAGIGSGKEGRRRIELGGRDVYLFFQRLNTGSAYPPAWRVALYSLEAFAERRSQLRLRIVGIGLLLLVGAFVASRLLAGRLARPVEKLALDSDRSARFSADASHQLKTPVTVLRAGLEELQTRENLTPEDCNAVAALIHQTYRLSSLIEDLLLLSRMDSGRLRLALQPVDLGHLIAAALDDLGAIPEDRPLRVETDLPSVLRVLGEERYTAIILQNLLENARKYNRPHGRVRIAARGGEEEVRLTIANTGRSIDPAAQARIFERFHRGAMGEDVPGYGLGLNLARELARLHGGELTLVRSDAEWTEFEVRFRAAPGDPIA